jgi:hypothetical protein
MEENDSGNFEGGTWGILKHALGAWWHHHPVSVAFGLARPTLKHYAEEKPLQLLGIAAAAGAAAVVLRPWRLVSWAACCLPRSSRLSCPAPCCRCCPAHHPLPNKPFEIKMNTPRPLQNLLRGVC